MLSGNGTSVYHPRQPQQSPLWKFLDTHYETFERDYEKKYFKAYEYRRAVVDDVVRDYLKCGDLPECAAPIATTSICTPSVARGAGSAQAVTPKKVVQSAELLRSNILSPVPHRQYVFTQPKILRIYFKYNVI